MSRFRAIVASRWFNGVSLAIVLANALLLGVEAYVRHPALKAMEAVFLWCFVAEIVARFLGRDSTRSFLRDGWNIFDIVIVGAAFIPEVGALSPMLRILRVFRVLRVVKSVPEMRLIVTVLLRSVISMKYIALLAIILFYVFAIIGHSLFGPYQREFATLHESLFTLFRVLTSDDWTQLRYEARGAVKSTAGYVTAYYVAWILIGTFVLINLIVGAIVNNYQEVQQIERRRARAHEATDERIEELLGELQELLRARREREQR